MGEREVQFAILTGISDATFVKSKVVPTSQHGNVPYEILPLTELDKLNLRKLFWGRLGIGVVVLVIIVLLAFVVQVYFGNRYFSSDTVSFETLIWIALNILLAFLAGLMSWGIFRAHRHVNDPWKIVYSGEVKELWRSGRVGDRTPGSGAYNLRLNDVRFQIGADLFKLLKDGDAIRVHCIAPSEVIDISRANSPEKSLREEIAKDDKNQKIGIVAIVLGILEIFHQC